MLNCLNEFQKKLSRAFDNFCSDSNVALSAASGIFYAQGENQVENQECPPKTQGKYVTWLGKLKQVEEKKSSWKDES